MRGHSDLNQGPIDLQSIALPLSYIPFSCFKLKHNINILPMLPKAKLLKNDLSLLILCL